MRKKLLSIILSLAMMLTMIPAMGSVAFAAESEDNATYKISVWQPVVGQAVPQDFYSVSCASSAPAIALSDDTCLRAKFGSGSCPILPGNKFSYDQEVLFHTSISTTVGIRFTGNETLSINGKPVPVVFSKNMDVMYINQEGYDEAFSLGELKRTPVSDIYLTGYKPVKMGTTPAVLSVDETADPGHVYEGKGYYTDNVMHKNEATSFMDGRDYWMHIRLEAAYDYSFEDITSGNIHIAGYDMPAEGFNIFAANGSDSIYPSYIEISLPAQRAQKNIYEFTIPEPKEGVLPAQAALKGNDDIEYTGIDWYKSKDGWAQAVRMEDGEKFEAGYDYYAQPQYSWKGEELIPGSYTIYVNGNAYNGEYFSFSHLHREVELKITVAEPKVGNTPAQTFSANIPISNQVCRWYFLPNAPSTDGFQPMEPTDKFALGCCYAFLPSFNYDSDIYDTNRIYVNGVDISEKGFMMFGPLAKQTQAIKNVNAAYSKVYGSAFTLKPTSATSRTYKSSNTKIATVSSAGKVTIKGIGTAKITITAAEDATYRKASKTVEIKAVPKTAAVSKSTPGKRKLTVKMGTKVASTGGSAYQIAYKQKGTSKWKYTTTTAQSKAIKKLKKGKKYYVKVRAYKEVSGTTYYGAWSETKLSKKIK